MNLHNRSARNKGECGCNLLLLKVFVFFTQNYYRMHLSKAEEFQRQKRETKDLYLSNM